MIDIKKSINLKLRNNLTLVFIFLKYTLQKPGEEAETARNFERGR